MTPEQVIEHYGDRVKTAAALGVTYQAVSQWLEKGVVPEGRQFQVELQTNGALKADVKAA